MISLQCKREEFLAKSIMSLPKCSSLTSRADMKLTGMRQMLFTENRAMLSKLQIKHQIKHFITRHRPHAFWVAFLDICQPGRDVDKAGPKNLGLKT